MKPYRLITTVMVMGQPKRFVQTFPGYASAKEVYDAKMLTQRVVHHGLYFEGGLVFEKGYVS